MGRALSDVNIAVKFFSMSAAVGAQNAQRKGPASAHSEKNKFIALSVSSKLCAHNAVLISQFENFEHFII